MRIAITTIHVPFTRGGAEMHADGLRRALVKAGHEAEIVSVPFKWYPPDRILDHMLASRLFDLTESNGKPIDRVIGLKFPAYLIPHPHKIIWILHQYRVAYDLWDTPYDDLIGSPNALQIRQAIRRADCELIPEARAVFANSRNVADRLKRFCGIEASPLYHPPQDAEKFFAADAGDYLFFPSRMAPIKRQGLVLEALALTRRPVRVHFSGTPDIPSHGAKLKEFAQDKGVAHRVKWLGFITEEEKRVCYARAKAVVFPPWDEDYGYVTLEAMLSSKAVITTTDSGGPLEFVRHEETGLISDPLPSALAEAFDRVWDDPTAARCWGAQGRELYDSLQISWPGAVARLLE